jgi:hypothetical protein
VPLTVINGPFIRAGESLSEPINCSGGDLVRITMPGDWSSGGNLTVQVSTDGQLFNDLFDARGTEITLVVTPGAAVPVLDLGHWTRMLGHLKFRSGARNAPHPQAMEREFAVTISTPDAPVTRSQKGRE